MSCPVSYLLILYSPLNPVSVSHMFLDVGHALCRGQSTNPPTHHKEKLFSLSYQPSPAKMASQKGLGNPEPLSHVGGDFWLDLMKVCAVNYSCGESMCATRCHIQSSALLPASWFLHSFLFLFSSVPQVLGRWDGINTQGFIYCLENTDTSSRHSEQFLLPSTIGSLRAAQMYNRKHKYLVENSLTTMIYRKSIPIGLPIGLIIFLAMTTIFAGLG